MLASKLYAIAKQALLLMPKSIVQVRIVEDGVYLLKNKQGEEFEITIDGDSAVHQIFTKLYYKTKMLFGLSFGQAILVTPDRANRNDFRALRVWLLWRQQAEKTKSA